MCTLSVIIDDQTRRWQETYPWTDDQFVAPTPYIWPQITREEFDRLKKEVEALRKLVDAAKEFDAATDQPDCESEEKIELLRKIAEALGVDIEVLGL